MPDKQLFEYAVIRIVPRVEREEFLNAGVIVYSRDHKFLRCKIQYDLSRVRALDDSMDLDMLKEHLEAFEKICHGDKEAGPIAQQDNASRFRWLTAVRSTIVQTSRVHPGLCDHPEGLLDKLFLQMVLPVTNK